jgi:ADP-ribose pyrophosphatase
MMSEKIPERSELVFKGRNWSVYQWHERMYDGTDGLFEGLRKNNNGAKIIATMNGKVLYTKERQPGRDWYYSLPGGIMDEGEIPLEAAKRELLEEAGLESDDWELLMKFDMVDLPRLEYYTYIYIARDCRKVAEQKLDNGEKIDIVEGTFEEFVEALLSPKSAAGAMAKKFLNGEENINKIRNLLKLK